MSGVCYEPYGCEWTLAKLWHSVDWLVRADLITLGLMLIYVFIVFIRLGLRRFPRERTGIMRTGPSVSEFPEFKLWEQKGRSFPHDLIVASANLTSITAVAPFLGSVGTCLGILNALSFGIAMERNAFLAFISSRIAAALLPSAAGIAVAVPAVACFNHLSVRAERLNIASKRTRLRFTRKLQLQKRLSDLMTFPLVAGASLALIVAVFTPFPEPPTPIGLPVHLSVSLRATPFIFRVMRDKKTGSVFVIEKRKRMSLDGLRTELNHWSGSVANLQAETDVTWADVANVIDVFRGFGVDVVLAGGPS